METNTAAFRIKATFKLFLALAVLLAGGVIAGGLFGLVGSYFYITFFFPAGMGIAAGVLAYAALRLANVRGRLPVLLVCVVAAGLVYGSQHYARYLVIQSQAYARLSVLGAEQGKEVSIAGAQALFQYGLIQETGHSGFLGYLLLRAKMGISIGRFYQTDRAVLTSGLAWIYWMLELGLVTWLALTIGRSSREVPVCEACGRRLSREKHLGGTVPANEALLLELVRRHDLQTLGHLLEKDAGLPSVEVYLRRCEACRQGPGRLTVRRATLGSRGVQLADLAESPLGPGDSALFLAGLRFEEE